MDYFKLFAAFSNFKLEKTEKFLKSFNSLDLVKQKKIAKALELLSFNPRHPGLHTHKIGKLFTYNEKDYDVFEAYIENNIPSAWRVLFCIIPSHIMIIVDIIPHL